MNSLLLIRIQVRGPLLALTVAAALLSGCGKEDIKVYRTDKDKPESAPTANPHAGGSMGAMGENPHAMAASTARIAYKLPAGWQERPASNMRVASFAIPGKDDQSADVSVIPLPGVGAHLTEMVNIWRQQLQLPEATEEMAAKSAEDIKVGADQGKLYDLASTEKVLNNKYQARIIAAILMRGETAWFFKLTGEDALVAAQKPAFLEFLKSVSFVSEPAGGMPPMAGGMPPMGGGMMAPAGGGDAPAKPAWTVPAGWKEEPPTQMLIAKFLAADGDAKAEITVSAFPGDVGGLLANVNRWRRQIGLPPIEDADLAKTVSEIDAQGGKAKLVDLDGVDAKSGQKARLVGVIVPQATQTWFYKLMGDEKVVAREKDALVKFVQSVK